MTRSESVLAWLRTQATEEELTTIGIAGKPVVLILVELGNLRLSRTIAELKQKARDRERARVCEEAAEQAAWKHRQADPEFLAYIERKREKIMRRPFYAEAAKTWSDADVMCFSG